MTIGSLFAGIGAFDLGFQQVGFETLWQVEIDRHCQKLLKGKFPKVNRTLDVRRFNPDKNECPEVVTFGSPCQDLSVAGQRSGINGERSGLFFHATRIIRGFVGRGLQFALWENVPGVLNSNGPRDFAAVLGTLAQCGAVDIGWRVLDCQWFGLAQRRKRVFLVADFGGRRAAEILSLAQSLQRDTAPSREKGQRIAPTVEGRAGRSGANNFATSGGLAHSLSSEGADASEDGTGRGTPLIPMTAQPLGSHHRRDDLDNDTYVPLAFTIHGTDKTQRIASETDVAGCVRTKPPGSQENSSTTVVAFSSKDSGNDAGALAPTITKNYATHHGRTAGNNGGVAEGQLQPVGSMVRRLTPTECERLMGFPDGWTAGFSDSVRYRMIGNSLAVPVAKWIADRTAKLLALQGKMTEKREE